MKCLNLAGSLQNISGEHGRTLVEKLGVSTPSLMSHAPIHCLKAEMVKQQIHICLEEEVAK